MSHSHGDLAKKREPKTVKLGYSCVQTSHLTTLVNRFLATLNDIKRWNQIDSFRGESKLKHHISNIIEYTFYIHKQQVTEEEVEKLIQLLEKRGNQT